MKRNNNNKNKSNNNNDKKDKYKKDEEETGGTVAEEQRTLGLPCMSCSSVLQRRLQATDSCPRKRRNARNTHTHGRGLEEMNSKLSKGKRGHELCAVFSLPQGHG